MDALRIKLAKKNREKDPASFDELYGSLVTKYIREGYSLYGVHFKGYTKDEVEAIVNNYLDDPNNEKYAAEFRALQNCRKMAKKLARQELDIEEGEE